MKRQKAIILSGVVLSLASVAAYIGVRFALYELKQSRVNHFKATAFKAFTADAQGDTQNALRLYEAALDLYDQEPKSLNALAALYRQQGQIAKAEALYLRLSKHNPDDFDARYNAALCSYLRGAYDEARTHAHYLIHHDERRAHYYRLLAMSHHALGEEAQAIGYYALLAHAGEGAHPMTEPLRVIYASADPKPQPTPIRFEYEETEALEVLTALLERYEASGEEMKALQCARKILSIDAQHQQAHRSAAALLFAHGSLEAVYAHANAITPKDAHTLRLLGASLQRLKRYDEAYEAYRAAYDAAPDTELLRSMAVCAHAQGNEALERETMERLKPLDPRLAHRLTYALELEEGKTHDTLDKVRYIALDELYRLYCLKGCGHV